MDSRTASEQRQGDRNPLLRPIAEMTNIPTPPVRGSARPAEAGDRRWRRAGAAEITATGTVSGAAIREPYDLNQPRLGPIGPCQRPTDLETVFR
jgi:hypothetical protein